MIAEFYNFAKKVNSTERPSSDSVLRQVEIIIKDNTSMTSPVIEIAEKISGDRIAHFNYCYIPALNRFYYITDCIYDRGIWCVSLSVDVLASFRESIGCDTRYILRSSAEFNGALQDMAYATIGKSTVARETETLWTNVLADDTPTSGLGGCYILTVTSKDGDGVGTAKLRGFTPAQFKTLSEFLFGTSAELEGEKYDSTLFNSMFNPAQYIVDCKWYPFAISEIGSGEEYTRVTLQDHFFIGKIAIPNIRCYSIERQFWTGFPKVLRLDEKHPQIERGSYLCRPPFSRYRLYIPPFGSIPLDFADSDNGAFVAFTITIDFFSGTALLDIWQGSDTHFITSAEIGVAVPLAQQNDTKFMRDWQLAIIDHNMQKSLLTLNSDGLVSGGTALANVAFSDRFDIRPVGNLGGVLATYFQDACLEATYIHVADEDMENNGRPLCAKRKISTIPGFIQCGAGYTKIPGRLEESEIVNRYMREGFYFV